MKKLMKKLEDLMMAVTFAEAGEYDTARIILSDGKTETIGYADTKPADETAGAAL